MKFKIKTYDFRILKMEKNRISELYMENGKYRFSGGIFLIKINI